MKFPYEVCVESKSDDAFPVGTPILRTAARAIADEITIAAARQGIPAYFTGPEGKDGTRDTVRYERNDPALTAEIADDAIWKGQAARARLAANEMRARGNAIPVILDRLFEMRSLAQNPGFRDEVTDIWHDVTGLIFNAITPIETVKYGIDFRDDANETVKAAAESWDVPVPNLLYCAGCGTYHGDDQHGDGRDGGLAAMLDALTRQFATEAADDPAAA